MEEIRRACLTRLDAEQRHEMRKALKNLRYQTEFFAPLFERRDTRRFVEQLKTLQDVFGYINDVRMAPRLIDVQKQRNAGIDAARAAAYRRSTRGRGSPRLARSPQGLERPGTLASVLGLMRLTAEIRWFWPDRPPPEFHGGSSASVQPGLRPGRPKHGATSTFVIKTRWASRTVAAATSRSRGLSAIARSISTLAQVQALVTVASRELNPFSRQSPVAYASCQQRSEFALKPAA